MARRAKKFYAVVKGYPAPAIFASWAIACAFTNGCKGNKHKGFRNLEEAKAYMEAHGIVEYPVFSGLGESSPDLMPSNRFFYAVANGREKGIYQCFQHEAKEKVVCFSHACYKRFDTLEQAEAFIENYEKAKGCLVQLGGSQGDASEMGMQWLNIN